MTTSVRPAIPSSSPSTGRTRRRVVALLLTLAGACASVTACVQESSQPPEQGGLGFPDAALPETSPHDATVPTPDGDAPDAPLDASAPDAARDTGIVYAIADGPPDATVDAGSDAADSGPADATVDAGSDAADSGPADGSPTYNPIEDASSWAVFPTGSLVGGGTEYRSGAFDGRYLYLVPILGNTPAPLARFDTQATFTDPASWATFDVTKLDANANGRVGAAFDGRYVYFAPGFGTNGNTGLVVRYDTTSPFTSASSYVTFDAGTVDAKAVGFRGIVFDGRYVYLVPDATGVVTRYDTAAPFGTATSWAVYDPTNVGAANVAYTGGAFDGRYVYFTPYQRVVPLASSSLYLRHDTQAGSFTDNAAWSTYDFGAVATGAAGFEGEAFDGRYVYLSPYFNGAASGVTVRYDTQGAFDAIGSYQAFDVSSAVGAGGKGFGGGVFDGRYVYFPPNYASGAYHGTTPRYDTTGSFTAASSWSSFDQGAALGASGFLGGLFDGRYVYFIPHTPTALVTRFDARTPPAVPPTNRYSFF
jgi:hypothetical protein